MYRFDACREQTRPFAQSCPTSTLFRIANCHVHVARLGPSRRGTRVSRQSGGTKTFASFRYRDSAHAARPGSTGRPGPRATAAVASEAHVRDRTAVDEARLATLPPMPRRSRPSAQAEPLHDASLAAFFHRAGSKQIVFRAET